MQQLSEAQLVCAAAQALQTSWAHTPLQQSAKVEQALPPAVHCPLMQWSAPLQL